MNFTTNFLHDSSENSEIYPCFQCNRVYRRMKTLNRHLRHECGKGKQFTCSICGHSTQRSDRLLTHIRSQHPDLAQNLPRRKKSSEFLNLV